jgi:hypothetical protein
MWGWGLGGGEVDSGVECSASNEFLLLGDCV